MNYFQDIRIPLFDRQEEPKYDLDRDDKYYYESWNKFLDNKVFIKRILSWRWITHNHPDFLVYTPDNDERDVSNILLLALQVSTIDHGFAIREYSIDVLSDQEPEIAKWIQSIYNLK